MSFPIIEALSGAVNGFNVTFETSRLYVGGSVMVFVNGVVRRSDYDDGWIESGGNRITLKEAPLEGDVVQVYYLPV